MLIGKRAETQEERLQILEMRTEVYRQVGKHGSSELMMDQFDEEAILLGIWKGDQLIASARILSQPSEAEWEHDRFWEWRSEFPARADTVEISRLCVLKEHRSLPMLRLLLQMIGRTVLELEKRYILLCATDSLSPFYERFLGARFTGDVITHEDLAGIPHRMYFVNVLTCLSGHGLGQLAWLSIWPDVAASALRAQGNPTAKEVLARYRLKILGGCAISQVALKAVRAHHKGMELVKMVMGRLSPVV